MMMITKAIQVPVRFPLVQQRRYVPPSCPRPHQGLQHVCEGSGWQGAKEPNACCRCENARCIQRRQQQLQEKNPRTERACTACTATRPAAQPGPARSAPQLQLEDVSSTCLRLPTVCARRHKAVQSKHGTSGLGLQSKKKNKTLMLNSSTGCK